MSQIAAGFIPKIEGFQPIPNAVMIPFMEAQSAALAYGFGLNYEYGKRKIRSMSNDEFNSLTSEDITNMSNAHTHIILSKFQLQVPAVMPMQTEIFKQYVIIEKAKVAQNVELFKWIIAFAKSTGDDAIAHLLGGHLHTEIQEPFVTPTDKFINPKTGEQGAVAAPSSTKLTPSQQQAAIKNILNVIRGLEKAIVEILATRKRLGANASSAIQRSSYTSERTARKELAQQKSFLSMAQRGQNPYV